MKKEIIFLTLLIFVLIPFSLADDNSKDTEQGVRVGGVVYDIAKDRKMDTIGGITQPEDLSKYVQRKVDGVNAQVNDLQNRLDRMEGQMNSMLALLKNNQAPKNNESSQVNSRKKETGQGNLIV